jgi:RNA polymerase sigma-70 factor (ECF subfamily)
MVQRRDPLADPEALIRRVYSYAAYRLGDGPDAEDATSETFARALRYRRSYDSKTGTPQAWLLGIARRVVGEHLLASGREGPAPDDSASVAGDIASSAVERLALRHALATLSKQERDLLALRYGGDLAVKEVARLLGARTNAVEVALHRVHAKLREEMGARASEQNRSARLPAQPSRDELSRSSQHEQGIGHEVALPESAGLGCESEGPLEPESLRPRRRTP